MNKKMNNKGFSLVELIVVIAIMAVLVGVLAPQFIKYVENSRQSTDMQNIQQLKTAIETYAASSEGLAADVTITLTGGSTKTAVVNNSAAVTESGLKATTSLKSAQWTDGPITCTYDSDTYSWSISGDFKTTSNNMKDIFE